MTAANFQKLQYGNIIEDIGSGQLSVVTFVDRDAKGNTAYVGLTPAIAIAAAPGFAIISKDVAVVTVIDGVMTGKTIQG